MAGTLSCDPEGLRAFAAYCGDCAEGIRVHAHAPLPAVSSQSTAAAVTELHIATNDAAGVLAERLWSTASALSSAADQYVQADDISGEILGSALR